MEHGADEDEAGEGDPHGPGARGGSSPPRMMPADSKPMVARRKPMPMMVPSLMWPGTKAMERWTRKVTLSTSMKAPAMKTQARPACHVMAVESVRFTKPYVK